MVLDSTSFSAPSSRHPQSSRPNQERLIVNPTQPVSSSSSLRSVSIVVPAYNEAVILTANLQRLVQYLEQLASDYDWELLVINDGSRDETGDLAEAFARTHDRVQVIHHAVNCGLGQALRTGFEFAKGDYIVTLDLDLSYAPEHIERLLDKIQHTGAKVVVTSPYMKGGRVSNVPWLRWLLSVWANRFLSLAAKRNISTLTGMVRAYEARTLKTLHFRSMGMEINPEIIHKFMLIGAKIEEIPAHLNWQTPGEISSRLPHSPHPPLPSPHQTGSQPPKRRSSMKIWRHIWKILFNGFVIRPVMFFILPSLLCFMLALYADSWVLIHCWTNYHRLAQIYPVFDPTEAVAAAFQQAPHTFIIGGMLSMLSIQLFSLGILSLQSKHYFEEVFYLGATTYRSLQSERDQSSD